MKLALSLLVVANVLLFGWLRGWMAPFGGDGREPARVERQVRPDALRVLPTGRPAAGAAAGAASGGAAAGASGGAGAGVPAPVPSAGSADARPGAEPPTGAVLVAALRGANCAELGPLAEADAVRVQVALDAIAADLAFSIQRVEEASSWWVYLPPGPVETLSRRLAELRERGVTDTYVMPDGPWKGAISLGVFRQEELAVGLQKSIAAKGIKGARVAPRGATPGRVTMQVRPVVEPVAAELVRLRGTIPDAVARPCAARG